MTRAADRIKFDRKALRGPDEFQTLTGRATEWLAANRNLAIGVGVGVLVVAAAALGVGWYGERRDEAAAIRFQSAHDDFAADRYTEAAESFAGLRQDYGRTPFGRLATLYQGHALTRAGDPAAAATAYGEYLASSPATPYLRQEALVGLGRARGILGEHGAALEAFQEAAELVGPYTFEARLGVARMHEQAGDLDAAVAEYASLLADDSVQLPPDVRRLVAAKVPPGTVEATDDTEGDAGS